MKLAGFGPPFTDRGLLFDPPCRGMLQWECVVEGRIHHTQFRLL